MIHKTSKEDDKVSILRPVATIGCSKLVVQNPTGLIVESDNKALLIGEAVSKVSKLI